MKDKKYELGLIGLGTMGQNLLMNMADSNFAVAGYDKDSSKVDALDEATKKYDIFAAHNIKEFISVLDKPRVVMLLVPAGKIVDYVIEDVLLLLEPGDIIIDGGNSHFSDTNRRVQNLKDTGIHFVGMGISGGAEGARRGPSMMPGGHPETWNRIKNIFEATAAKADGEPCVAYIGENSAGHYVKMVHNGIEYGLMELLAEAYHFMKNILGMDNASIGQTFRKWNEGRLKSFLVEITAEIFFQKDDLTDNDLIDMILDASRSKGTGKWTSQDAMNLQAPITLIDTAVSMRELSGALEERHQASTMYTSPQKIEVAKTAKVIDQLEDAMYFSFITAYAQGMAQLTKASKEYQYNLNMESIAAIWRAGCIIRASLLEDFRAAYQKNADLENLLLDADIAKTVDSLQSNTRAIAQMSLQSGVSMMGLISAITYFDAYRTKRLPANLIQAQRDFFGSHTYERIDKEGKFHANWG